MLKVYLFRSFENSLKYPITLWLTIEEKEERKRQESILETGQLIIHVVYNSFGSRQSQDRLWLCNKKKKNLYCPTISQRMMESKATNCRGFTGKGHVLKQSISWLPHTPRAVFFPKAKNLTIPFCVTFFKYFNLTFPKYIHFSQIVHMWVLGDC